MAKKTGCSFCKQSHPAGETPKTNQIQSQVGVASRQHRGKAGHFHLAPRAFARLLVMTMGADFLQSTLAVQPFLEPAQRLVDGLAFFQLNFCQLRSLPSGGSDPTSPAWRVRVGSKSAETREWGAGCQRALPGKKAPRLKGSKLKGSPHRNGGEMWNAETCHRTPRARFAAAPGLFERPLAAHHDHTPPCLPSHPSPPSRDTLCRGPGVNQRGKKERCRAKAAKTAKTNAGPPCLPSSPSSPSRDTFSARRTFPLSPPRPRA